MRACALAAAPGCRLPVPPPWGHAYTRRLCHCECHCECHLLTLCHLPACTHPPAPAEEEMAAGRLAERMESLLEQQQLVNLAEYRESEPVLEALPPPQVCCLCWRG